MPTDQITAFEKFLNYGPIGLAGLMLVLVVAAISLRNTTTQQANLLKFFMVIGAICFVVATAAEFFARPVSYRMSVLVAPNNLADFSHFPPPVLSLNGETINGRSFDVAAPTNLLVDLTGSVNAYRDVQATASRASNELDLAVSKTEQLETDVAQLRSEVDQREAALREANEISAQVSAKIEALSEIADSQSTPVAPLAIQRAVREIDSLQRSFIEVLR